MKQLLTLFSRRLYLRIWLAVVGGVAVLTLSVAWVWHMAEHHNARAQNAAASAPPREMQLKNAHGQVLTEGRVTRIPGASSDVARFAVSGSDGQSYELLISARRRGGGAGRAAQDAAAFWLAPPLGFLWMLALVGVAVAGGVFPIIRRLLQRLETLQRGVQRFGEGDLSARVNEAGRDEVADLARQFNAAAARIEALVAAHKNLLANASHELRSPLTRIRMSLALAGQDGAARARAHDEIARNITELDQLIDEILLASRLESPEADIGTLEEVDLVALAAEECARVAATLHVGADSSVLHVRAIARLLRRAVRNLLENARRYSSGAIDLHLARCAGNSAEVRVCDHGPGVPPAERERIFDKFYRARGASEHSGGVGLGLALVRSIARRHGGTVQCLGRDDGQSGACFVLRLPL